MKKYIKPTIEVIKIGTIGMLASSGDTLDANFYGDETHNGVFNARSYDYEEGF